MDPEGNGLLSMFFSKNKKKNDEQTEEEIRMLVGMGNQNGSIEESQKDMINNIFDFDDITVAEVMTHRTDIVAVSIDCDIMQVVKTVIEEGFSRIPVFEDDIDNIIGIIYAKDLLRLIGQSEPETIKNFVRPTIYIPTSNRCRELFEMFTKEKIHLAVVVDEYGGTAGIVTMEDIIESIVGNIQDEYDNEVEEIFEEEKNTFIIEGSADLDSVSRALNINIESHEDYDTLAGFITDLLGRIPNSDEQPSVEYSGVEFTVVLVEDRRILKVKAVILPKI
jgi:putative hemolysin